MNEEVEIFNRIKPTVPPEWYIPYEDNPRGVPAMANFGDGYRYHVTGLTHDVRGFPTSRPDEIDPFIRRLFRKISQNFADLQIGEFFETDDADITVIAYGCVARSAKRAVLDARESGIESRAFEAQYPLAFYEDPGGKSPSLLKGRYCSGDEYGTDIEGSKTGQQRDTQKFLRLIK